MLRAVWRAHAAARARLEDDHGSDLGSVPPTVVVQTLLEVGAADGLTWDWFRRPATLAAARDLVRILSWAQSAAGDVARGA
jgi:hypothetical protein